MNDGTSRLDGDDVGSEGKIDRKSVSLHFSEFKLIFSTEIDRLMRIIN